MSFKFKHECASTWRGNFVIIGPHQGEAKHQPHQGGVKHNTKDQKVVITPKGVKYLHIELFFHEHTFNTECQNNLLVMVTKDGQIVVVEVCLVRICRWPFENILMLHYGHNILLISQSIKGLRKGLTYAAALFGFSQNGLPAYFIVAMSRTKSCVHRASNGQPCVTSTIQRWNNASWGGGGRGTSNIRSKLLHTGQRLEPTRLRGQGLWEFPVFTKLSTL